LTVSKIKDPKTNITLSYFFIALFSLILSGVISDIERVGIVAVTISRDHVWQVASTGENTLNLHFSNHI